MNIDAKCVEFNECCKQAHTTALNHGFYDDYNNLDDYLSVNDQPQMGAIAYRNFILAQLAKIASEVGESVSVVQKQKDYEGLAEELADIVIRTMDLATFMGYELGTHIALKMAKNEARPYKHGKIC